MPQYNNHNCNGHDHNNLYCNDCDCNNHDRNDHDCNDYYCNDRDCTNHDRNDHDHNDHDCNDYLYNGYNYHDFVFFNQSKDLIITPVPFGLYRLRIA